ncbi:type III-B CRISPR module RAMP protein Cmr1 [Clostridium botulinum]|nr:type III-B CRISPR module RAMP protein Cmr1 [Clostridium botulinum]
MKKVKVTLEVVTPMFSTGSNINKEAEFRITELKALIRSIFREFYNYDSEDDLKKKEEILFGSTNKKSPVSIRFGYNKKNIFTGKKNLVLHKEVLVEAIPIGTTINIIFQGRNEKILKVYSNILKLASIVGGLGKRSRKGMGSFKIKDIVSETNDINNRFENLLNECNELEIEGKKYVIETRNFLIDENEDDYIRYKIEYDNNIPNIHYAKYIHKIFIGNSINEKDQREKIKNILKKISELTHKRLIKAKDFLSEDSVNEIKKLTNKDICDEEVLELVLNKDILGNYNYNNKDSCKRGLSYKSDLTRFASPIYVTVYQQVQGKSIKNYIIIEELNYNYIYNEIINIRRNKKEKELKNKNKENIAKEINKEVEEFKPMDEEYIKSYINEIKKCCKEEV